MLTALFLILMMLVFGNILVFAAKAAWGIWRILFSLILLPIALVGMVLGGLIHFALPLLLIVGGISLLALHD